MRAKFLIAAWLGLVACSAEETVVTNDFGFDGTCVNCHAGLSAAHVHPNYKLRCVDCHGGNDTVAIDAEAFKTEAKFRDPKSLIVVHVVPKPGLARFFFANGIDDDGDGVVDNPAVITDLGGGAFNVDFGEVFEPNLHGEGAGEFLDTELNRDLNYTRFLNPGDLRVASIGCGASNRAAGGTGNAFGCHQQTIDTVRRSMMVNNAAVVNGAYYGNETSRSEFTTTRGNTKDPRAGAFAYSLDYAGADKCIHAADPNDSRGDHAQPFFQSDCLEARAASQDPAVAADAPGNAGLPAFEIAEGTIDPAPGTQPGTTIDVLGAGDLRYPWGGTMITDTDAERAKLAPLPNGDLLPGVPDPVDNILRTFRAYYPLNYPGSTINFNFTFGTSIEPDIGRFTTQNPFGRGHSSGCTACHAQYAYDGARSPTRVLQDDGSVVLVTDPTTKHREFDAKTQDRGTLNGQDRLIGRAVKSQEQTDTGRAQQKYYSQNHNLTTAITTDQCGLCHGFVTRINYAYQGMAEEEQRDQLSRRKALAFDTPNGTHVVIHDSWVREDNISGQPVVIAPAEGLATIAAAKKRDADLAAQGFVAGNGGCGQAVFTEDCNNNGELDHNLVLQKVDEDGNVIATTTIDEDLNHDGKLDLIDRLPRENSIDGRQMRYVYGGRNGSTRLMDVHFERGMHCIDCHFLQDVHGDGHVYSTNWDQIEIECEDCHGSGRGKTNFLTSGPNGGNDLRRAHDQNLRPYFEEKGGQIIQRSRVTPGLFWVIPQTVDQKSALSQEAHQDAHVAAPGSGSTFNGPQGSSKLTAATLECATCHSSWIHNCVGCHVDINIGDKQRKKVDPTGHAVTDPGENEVWMSNANSAGHTNFQLLGLLRAPFVLGVSSSSEKGRLGTFRSSMQAHVTASDATGDNIIDNATATTFQTLDANSQRMNVATSGVAMNQTMAHTVRPAEARGCELCHTLVDTQGRVRNEHLMAESFGLGAGVLPFVGDWAIATGGGGLELYEYKAEKELAANKADPAGASTRFPGLIVDPNSRTAAKVEPIFDGSGGVGATSVANDVVLIRNFNPTPALGGVAPATLRDLAVVSVDIGGGGGRLVITDITGRGSRGVARQSVGATAKTQVITLPQTPRSLAHIGPDVSDPFVYVAVGVSGVSVVRIDNAPTTTAPAGQLVRTVLMPGSIAAIKVALAGDLLYVGTGAGTIEVFSLSQPDNPTHVGTATVGDNVTGLAVAGFMLYASTPTFIAAFQLDDPSHPAPPSGTSTPVIVPGIGGREISFSAGHLYVASNVGGIIDLDVRTPAQPVNRGDIAAALGATGINATDVIVSVMPGQTWLLALDLDGSLWGLKLDNRKSTRERCFPDPVSKGCLLDMDFLDATVTGRDPSFDPNTNTFDATDPSGNPVFHQLPTILNAGRRLARPTQWEQIGTLSGRRYRDSFMPGSGVLSLEVMQQMRMVELCESNGKSNAPGNLGGLGYADDAFKQTGNCQPLGISARTIRQRAPNVAKKVCRPQTGFSRAVCAAGEPLAVSRSP